MKFQSMTTTTRLEAKVRGLLHYEVNLRDPPTDYYTFPCTIRVGLWVLIETAIIGKNLEIKKKKVGKIKSY